MTNKTIEERYKKLTQREHVLKKPGMYIGNIETEPNNMFVFEDIDNIKESKFIYKYFQLIDWNCIQHSCNALCEE